MNTPINKEIVSTATAGEDIEGGNAKNSALFPLKHLFSIVDGRLSTSISDIQSIFGVYCGRSVFTHGLPENPIGICRLKGLLITSNGGIIRMTL